MSKELTVVSWNVLDNINDPEVQRAIISTGLDFGVFPEAASEDNGVATETFHNFKNQGYEIVAQPYDDNDGRKDRHNLAMVYKQEVIRGNPEAVRLAGRTALKLTLASGAEFTGVHLDDRREATRLAQVAALIASGRTHDAVLAGDLNAMYVDGVWAQRLNMLLPVAGLIPRKSPGETDNKLLKTGSKVHRLINMSRGSTMEQLLNQGFVDADPLNTPTMSKGPIEVQLDHIMTRGNITVTEPTRVESAEGLSDHSRIQAIIHV